MTTPFRLIFRRFSCTALLVFGLGAWLLAQQPQGENRDRGNAPQGRPNNQQQAPTGARPGQGQGAGPWANAAQANIGRFYGKVVDDATGKGVGYASVQLIAMRFDTVTKKMKSVVIAGQLTEENGDFSLENLPVRGEFTLKIAYLGYANIEQKVSFGIPGGRPGGGGKPANNNNGGGGRPNGEMGANAANFDKDLGNIRLSASAELLKEVEIRGEATQVTLALDKKVYRVDKDAVAAGGTAEDALKNVPSIQVDIDGNVTMRNSAPQIFVDGRPTTLSIDQIPADAIESIEVITNPSAKYDASGGNAGILNIVLKKERRIGYNGNVRTGVDMRGRVNLGGDLNLRQSKINAFVGGNYNQRRSLSTSETDRQNLLALNRSNVGQQSDSRNDGFFMTGRTGVDWFIDNRNTLTFAGNIHGGDFNSVDNLDIQTENIRPSGSTLTNSDRATDNQRQFRNYGSQILFKHLFPQEGREWTADINYNLAVSNNEGVFNTTILETNTTTRQRQVGDGTNEFITFQTDYVAPLKKAGAKMEAGGRVAIRNYESENSSYNFNFGDNEYVRAPNFADRYRFDDRVFAAYGTYSQSFAKWGYQMGLRAESSMYDGKLLDTDSTFGIDFPIALFPSAFITYKLNEDDNLQFNYSRRVNRPSFFQLIPFPDFSDSLLLSRGNPGLLPEFTNSLEVSYQNVFSKGHNILLSAYYKLSDNLITRYQFSERIADREVIVSSYANSNSSQAYGVEMTLRNNFWKIFELTTNLNLYNSIVDASNVEANLKVEQFSWFFKENMNIRFPKSFTLQLNGSYVSRTAFGVDSGSGRGGRGGGGGGGGGWGGGPSNTAQGYTIPVWFMDVSVRKDLWKRTASITLSMQDIFRSRRNGSHSESTGIFIQDTWRRRDPQLVRLNFSYRFGKMDVSLFRRKNNRTEEGGMDF